MAMTSGEVSSIIKLQYFTGFVIIYIHESYTANSMNCVSTTKENNYTGWSSRPAIIISVEHVGSLLF